MHESVKYTIADRFGHLAGLAVIAVVGAVLAVAAAPKLIAFTKALPGDPVLSEIRRQRPVDDEAVTKLVTSYIDAVQWYARGRTLSDLGLAHMVRSDLAVGGHMGELLQAERRLIQSLDRAPMNPHTWVRLSALWSRLQMPPSLVVGALMTSLRVGRVSKRLLITRVQLFLTYWDALDESARRAAIEQLKYAKRQYHLLWLSKTLKQFGRTDLRNHEDFAFLREAQGG
jgi:hypothetical protein